MLDWVPHLNFTNVASFIPDSRTLKYFSVTPEEDVQFYSLCSLFWSSAKSRRRKVECIDQVQNLCQMYVDFSYILVVFSHIDKFPSFGFIWQLETHRNSLLIMSLQFDLVSYFPRKEAKLFYFEGFLKPVRGSLACPKNNNMANDSDQLDCSSR